MEMQDVKKFSQFFTFNLIQFYDVATGPGATRAVVADVGQLGVKTSDARRYAYGWYYDSNDKAMSREAAAQMLISQHGFILCEFKAGRLKLGRLSEKGIETGHGSPCADILFGQINAVYHRATAA